MHFNIAFIKHYVNFRILPCALYEDQAINQLNKRIVECNNFDRNAQPYYKLLLRWHRIDKMFCFYLLDFNLFFLLKTCCSLSQFNYNSVFCFVRNERKHLCVGFLAWAFFFFLKERIIQMCVSCTISTKTINSDADEVLLFDLFISPFILLLAWWALMVLFYYKRYKSN